jgi:hypothetical protein
MIDEFLSFEPDAGESIDRERKPVDIEEPVYTDEMLANGDPIPVGALVLFHAKGGSSIDKVYQEGVCLWCGDHIAILRNKNGTEKAVKYKRNNKIKVAPTIHNELLNLLREKVGAIEFVNELIKRYEVIPKT